MRKEIKMLGNFEKSGLQFKKGETLIVDVLKIEIAGGFNRYSEDGIVEGDLAWSVLVEFENGKIMTFDLDYHIHIVGDAE
jgi:hypothetical protein